jgi:hypothetical protein
MGSFSALVIHRRAAGQARQHRRHAAYRLAAAGPATAIMDSVPDTPDPQTRSAVTQRIIAHVTRGWPRLSEPIVRHRAASAPARPDHSRQRLPETSPISRLA